MKASRAERRSATRSSRWRYFDETDSGLDIDALRIVADGVQAVREKRPEMGVLIITHYQRLLDRLNPDHVHIMSEGRIVRSGGIELVETVEASGFESFSETL